MGKIGLEQSSFYSRNITGVFFRCVNCSKVNVTRCLKITEKVSFNIASEASYVYLLLLLLLRPASLRELPHIWLRKSFRIYPRSGRFFGTFVPWAISSWCCPSPNAASYSALTTCPYYRARNGTTVCGSLDFSDRRS